MKKVVLVACICALSILTSCKKEDPEAFWEATATIKTGQDESCYFQIDDQTALISSNSNFQKNPYGKELRVRMRYYDRGDATKPGWSSTPTWKKGEIFALDTILTKKPVPMVGKYGKARIELYNSWMNTIEDGYMTLSFEAWFGGTGAKHIINLVRTEDPHVFQLKHDDAGDPAAYRAGGLVAFDIHDMPIPNQKEFDVTLKYTGYLKDKAIKFHYKDGKFSAPESVDVNGYLE